MMSSINLPEEVMADNLYARSKIIRVYGFNMVSLLIMLGVIQMEELSVFSLEYHIISIG
jgi:hypothetical protein